MWQSIFIIRMEKESSRSHSTSQKERKHPVILISVEAGGLSTCSVGFSGRVLWASGYKSFHAQATPCKWSLVKNLLQVFCGQKLIYWLRNRSFPSLWPSLLLVPSTTDPFKACLLKLQIPFSLMPSLSVCLSNLVQVSSHSIIFLTDDPVYP